MALAGSLFIEMSSNVARITADMNATRQIVGSSMKSVESAVSSAKNMLATLGVGLSVGAVVAYTKAIIDAADAINDMSQRTGIAVKDLAKYELAAKQSGTTMEALSKGVKGISTNLAEHGDALKKAGLSATTADGAMRQLADLFKTMPDGVEKTALAVKMFGKSGMDLIPMLNGGSEGLDKAAEKSAKYAAIMATLAPQADEFNDVLAELGMYSKVAGMSMMNDMLPALTAIVKKMTEATAAGGLFKGIMAGLDEFGNRAFDWQGNAQRKDISNLEKDIAKLQSDDKWLSYFGPSGQLQKQIDAKIALLETAKKAYYGPMTLQGGDKGGSAMKIERPVADWMAEYKKLMDAMGTGEKNPYIKLQEAAEKYVVTLKKEADQLGMTDREKKLYDANVVALTLHKGTERDAFIASTTKLIEEIDAYKKAIEVAKERAALRQKESDGIDAWMRAQDEAYAAAVKGAQDATAAARTEYEQMGMSKSQIAEITLLTLASTQAKFNDGTEGFNALQKQIDAQKELIGWLKKTETKQAGIDAVKAINEEFKRGWEETDRIGRETFIGLALEGKTFADTVGKALKTSLASGLYDVFVKPVLLQVYTSVTGGALGAAGGAAGGGIINGALGSMIGSGATISALGTAFGEGFMATLGGSSLSGGAAAGILATGGAAGAGTMGMIGAAAPYVGLALALYSVFSEHGTPKLEAGFSPNGMNIGGRDALGNMQGSQRGDVAAAQTISAGIVAAYQTVAQQLGIKNGKIDVGVFYAQDPTGESATQLQIIGGAYNRSNAMGGIENAGKSTQDLQDAIAKSAAQLVLTNLQSSDLPAYMKQVFGALDSSATSQQINDAVAFASGLKQIRDALTETRTPLQIMADDMKALGTTAETFKTDFVAAIDAGINPENLAAWQHLGQEIEQLTPPVEKAAEAIATISEGMRNMASDRKSLEGQLATLQGRAWEAQGVDLSNAAEAAAWAYNEGLRADIKAIEDANTAEQERADAVTAAAEALQQATNQAIDSLAALRAKYADPLTTQTAAEQIAQTLGANVADILAMDSAGMRLFVRTLSKEIDPATEAGKRFLTTLEGLSPAFDVLITGAGAAKTAVEAVAAAFDWVGFEAGVVADYAALMDKWSSSIKSAYANVQSSLAGVGSAVEALHSKQISAQQKVNDLTRTAADNLFKFAGTISDFLDTINPATGPNASLASLKAQLSATAVLAAGGDVGAQGKLITQAQAVLKAAEAGSKTALEYARSEAFVRSTLEPIQKKATTQAAGLLATLTTTVNTAGLDIAHSLGLTGTAADKLAGLLHETGTASNTLATLLAKPGTSATALASGLGLTEYQAKLFTDQLGSTTTAANLLTGNFGDASTALTTAVHDNLVAQADYQAALTATSDLHLKTAGSLDALNVALAGYDQANISFATTMNAAGTATGMGVNSWVTNMGLAGTAASDFATAAGIAAAALSNSQAGVVRPIVQADTATAQAKALYQANPLAMQYNPSIMSATASDSRLQWLTNEIERNGFAAAQAMFNGTVTNYVAAGGLPQYASGTNYMQQDGPVYAHQGETITPRPYVDLERGARAETNALMARLVASNERLEAKFVAASAELVEIKKSNQNISFLALKDDTVGPAPARATL